MEAEGSSGERFPRTRQSWGYVWECFSASESCEKTCVLVMEPSWQRVRHRQVLTAESFLQPAEFHGSPVRRESDVVQISCREAILE